MAKSCTFYEDGAIECWMWFCSRMIMKIKNPAALLLSVTFMYGQTYVPQKNILACLRSSVSLKKKKVPDSTHLHHTSHSPQHFNAHKRQALQPDWKVTCAVQWPSKLSSKEKGDQSEEVCGSCCREGTSYREGT